MAKFLPKYEEEFRKNAEAFGIDPDDEKYGSLTLTARAWFELGLLAAGAVDTRPEDLIARQPQVNK